MSLKQENNSKDSISKVGFGGGCHWCTEAVFQKIIGVVKVEQGWITSKVPNDVLSEAVVVHFDEKQIDMATLIAIHLHTHSCTSTHPMRAKYRSAIYYFRADQINKSKKALKDLQQNFDKPIITVVLSFVSFKENVETYQNYYLKHPEGKFCKTYIHPKFKILMDKFSDRIL